MTSKILSHHVTRTRTRLLGIQWGTNNERSVAALSDDRLLLTAARGFH